MPPGSNPRPPSSLILVVEDDPIIASALKKAIEGTGLRAAVATDGPQALHAVSQSAVDLVILDLGLPGMDGWQVLDRLRKVSEAPILILSGRGKESEKVRGLLGGADDYVVKPVGRAELLARVEAVLRRRHLGAPARQTGFDDGTVAIDHRSRTVRVRGELVELSALEFRLLSVLTESSGTVVPTEALLERVWGDPMASSPGRVKFAIARLRKKCGWTTDDSPLVSLRSAGYCYTPVLATPLDLKQ